MQFARMCDLAPITFGCIRGSCHRTKVNDACAECSEHRELMVSLVGHFKLPPILLNDAFLPPPDNFPEREKLIWWGEYLEEAVEEARDEDAALRGRRSR